MGIQRGAVARSKHTTSRAIGDEFIVVDRRGRTAHALSGEHAQVWRELGGDHRQVVVLTDAERADAVAELRALGLLSSGVDRRAVLRRAGIVGGVTVGAGIASIALPDPAMAKSQPVVGQTTAGTFSFTVPTGEDITRIEFTVNGAGGGGRPGLPIAVGPGAGGSGVRITGRITRPASAGGLGGVVISGFVGGAGKSNGGGGAGSVGSARAGGSGGASTGIFPLGAGGGGATTLLLDGTTIVIAGAGGGAPVVFGNESAGINGGAEGGNGGAGAVGSAGRGGTAASGPNGGAGGDNSAANTGLAGGTGSNDAAGGAGGTGGAGVASGTGGVNPGAGGGGGGGGYAGGGGGEGGGGNGSGGGGGGASSLVVTGTTNDITVTQVSVTRPNSGSGAGGVSGSDGTDGSVSLTYRTFV